MDKLRPELKDKVLGVLYEHAPFAVLIADPERRIVTCNAALESLFGYSRDDLIGRSTEILYATHEDFLKAFDQFNAVEREIGPNRAAGPIEIRYKKRNGKIFLAAVQGSRILDDSGQPIAAIGVFQNISFQRQIQHQFEHLFQYAPVLIVQKHLDGRIIRINNAFANFFGHKPEELIGTIASRLQPGVEDIIKADDAKVVASGTPIMGVLREIRSQSGEIGWMLVNKIPLKDPVTGETTLLTIGTDVTELKTREAELEAKSAELESFAYMASHDLQEPMRKISMFASILTDDLSDQDDRDHAIAVMTDSARRARTLIRDLLNYSRSTKGELHIERVSLSKLIDQAIEALASSIEETQSKVEIDVCGVWIDADPSQAELLIQNLLSNAIKYRRDDVTNRITVSASAADNGHTVLSVEDNGIGMDEEHIEQIFRPFVRLHSRSQIPGSGVGLAVCKAVADRHGWSISARHAGEQGMVFDVIIGPAGKSEKKAWPAG